MEFSGVFTALITPFLADGSFDEDAYRKQIERQIKAGINGILPCGTTGESPTLSHQEHDHIVEIAVEMAKGKIPVIAGAGSNSTREATRLSVHAQEAGADAVLSVNPYYNKPTQNGLFLHFKTIANSIDIPVVLYNIQGRTGVNLETDTLLALASECKNIVVVKEASGDLEQMKSVIKKTDDNFSVLSGDDGLTLDLIKEGGNGVISVASNVVPEKMVALAQHALDGNFDEATKIHDELAQLFDVMFIETNPIPVKTAMSMMGLCEEVFRLPLCALSTDENREKLRAVLKKMYLI